MDSVKRLWDRRNLPGPTIKGESSLVLPVKVSFKRPVLLADQFQEHTFIYRCSRISLSLYLYICQLSIRPNIHPQAFVLPYF